MNRRIVFLVASIVLTAGLAAEESVYVPTNAERARWTMGDMRSWATALGAYHQDNGAYPAANSIDTLKPSVEPMYIRIAPLTDAWGTAYKVVSTKDGFRIISAGADRKFDDATWGLASNELPSWSDDAVIDQSGMRFFRSWKYE
ncbi:MAG: type II secretion system protein GspG [Thermoanaerobaculia bacterium]|jgi:hypothetical protein